MALLTIIAVLAGCGKPDSVGDDTSVRSVAKGYRAVVQGAVKREYILHVPSSYTDKTPTPLLICFHGFGGSASAFSQAIGEGYSNLNSLADSKNFFVAYPQGVVRTKEGAEWDPGDNGSQSINDNDVFFVERLILDIGDNYNIDVSRVYAAGYSNGGMMAYGLACSKGGLIAAVGIMSGIMLPESCDAKTYTSIIHFHGIADGVLPYDGNQYFQAVPDVIHFWINHNNILESSLVSTQLNGGDVVRDAYSGGNEDTSVVLYTVNREHDKPGGHVWFTDDIDGASPNQIMWDFFTAHRIAE